MCATCSEAEVNYGLDSVLAGSIRALLHPPTQEQLDARQRSVADLVAYLDACDEDG